MRERLVLDEIEREKVSDLFRTKAVVTALSFDDNGAASQSNISELISTSMPWLVPKKDFNNKMSVDEGTAAGRLIAAYKKMQEEKGK